VGNTEFSHSIVSKWFVGIVRLAGFKIDDGLVFSLVIWLVGYTEKQTAFKWISI
jgi:hypothetical protein